MTSTIRPLAEASGSRRRAPSSLSRPASGSVVGRPSLVERPAERDRPALLRGALHRGPGRQRRRTGRSGRRSCPACPARRRTSDWCRSPALLPPTGAIAGVELVKPKATSPCRARVAGVIAERRRIVGIVHRQAGDAVLPRGGNQLREALLDRRMGKAASGIDAEGDAGELSSPRARPCHRPFPLCTCSQ